MNEKIRQRNNVKVEGNGDQFMIFAHGFGCDQNMWRFVTPAFMDRYRVVVYDHVGAGQSDLKAYNPKKYHHRQGYADDLIEICQSLGEGEGKEERKGIFVGHSVSAIIGILAAIKNPTLFEKLILIGPSPCYLNDGEDYRGGFEREDIISLLESMDQNYLGWSSTLAPMIMGNPERPELAEELTNSFCRTDPQIAKEFARVTFFSDNREDLLHIKIPSHHFCSRP